MPFPSYQATRNELYREWCRGLATDCQLTYLGAAKQILKRRNLEMTTATKDNRRSPKKGRGVGRARVEPDISTFSGRVAARIRALRDKHGVSVEELATRTGIEVATLYRYENGHRKPDPDLYPSLAKAFGLSIAAFLPKN
jgi:ribosome-binding protein aMBF1 (putative translation factor)